MKYCKYYLAAAICCAPSVAMGQITTVGPFIGDLSEPFDVFDTSSAVLTKNIFGGAAQLQAPEEATDGRGGVMPGGVIKAEMWSSLGGDLASPRTGDWILAFLFLDGETRPGTFLFDNTGSDVYRFGGYFNNNSHTPDAIFRFYDSNDVLLGSYTASIPDAGNQWFWHGWESTVPIKKVTIRGLSPDPFAGGFIWFDDLELGFSPPLACVSADCGGTVPDSQVNVTDLLELLANWGPGAKCDIAPPGGDGVINVTDLLDLLAAWGACP